MHQKREKRKKVGYIYIYTCLYEKKISNSPSGYLSMYLFIYLSIYLRTCTYICVCREMARYEMDKKKEEKEQD